MAALIYGLHLLFWAPFIVRGRLDRATGRAQDGPSAHAVANPGGLVGLHTLGIGIMYFGIGYGAFGGPLWTLFPFNVAAGMAVIAAGMVLSLWTLMVFRSWRLRAELTADHELCTSGPFGIVRHPIYTALVLLSLGSFLILPNAITLGGIVVTAITGDIRARAEETLLIGAFGQQYRDYLARTRRFVPGLY